MTTLLIAALCFAHWLYVVIVMRNGGGAGSILALAVTLIVAIAALVYFLAAGEWLSFVALAATVLAALLIAIFVPEDDLLLS